MPYDPQKHEVLTIKETLSPFSRHKGSIDDPTGMHSKLDLTQGFIGRPEIEYKNYLIEVDIGEDPEVLGGIIVYWICPRCTNASQIRSINKQMEYDRERNLLSIEPFECPNIYGGKDANDGVIVTGAALCKLRLGVDRNRGVEARR